MNYKVDIDETVKTHDELLKEMYEKVAKGDQSVMQEIAMPGVDTRVKIEKNG